MVSPQDVLKTLPSTDTLLRWVKVHVVLEVCSSELGSFGRDKSFIEYPDGTKIFSHNSGGDDYSVIFTDSGTLIKVFSHESEISPWGRAPRSLYPGIFTGLPESLHFAAYHPSFDVGYPDEYNKVPNCTLAFWQLPGSNIWHMGDAAYDSDSNEGSDMLSGLAPERCLERYYSFVTTPASSFPVEHLEEGLPLTRSIVAAFNASRSYEDVVAEVSLMRYPCKL